jgi:predicted tellurium resistance membrane protein TerC
VPGQKTFASAVAQVAIADVSMSLDNVLAVAGAAREHPYIMAFGLLLSIALMAVAAGWIARLIDRHRWIAYVGLAIILWVAGKMIWDGGQEVWGVVNGA